LGRQQVTHKVLAGGPNLENTMKNHAYVAHWLMLLGGAFAASAHADAPLDTSPDRHPIVGFGVPLTPQSLQDLRGGFESVKNDLQLSGTVADNLARNVVTGNNTIADGSFANVTGFPIVIQNSGANVLIQNATIINIQY
jgi:hypothetical protein